MQMKPDRHIFKSYFQFRNPASILLSEMVHKLNRRHFQDIIVIPILQYSITKASESGLQNRKSDENDKQSSLGQGEC